MDYRKKIKKGKIAPDDVDFGKIHMDQKLDKVQNIL